MGSDSLETRNLELFKRIAPDIYGRLQSLTPKQKEAAQSGKAERPAKRTRFTLAPPVAEKIDVHTFRFLQTTLGRATGEGISFFDRPQSSDAYFLIVIGASHDIDLNQVLDRTRSLCVVVIEPDMVSLWRSFRAFDWQAFAERIDGRGGQLHFFQSDDPNEISGDLWRLVRATNPTTLDSLTCITCDHWPLAEAVIGNLSHEAALVVEAMGHFHDESLMLYNAYRNLSAGSSRICVRAPLSLRRELPAFIVASGPSLDSDLDAIHELAERAVVISCGSALRPLMKNGIVPDFQIEIENIDVTPLVSQVDEAHDLSPVCLVASVTVDPDVLPHFGKRAYFFRSSLSPYSIFCDLGEEGFYPVGPTVANAGFHFAIEMGFRDCYLFGVDMGSMDMDPEVHHSKDAYYYTEGAVFNENLIVHNIPVPGNFGGTCHTSRGLYPSLINLGDMASFNDDAHRYFNCSDGAAVRGTIPTKSDDISLPDQRIDKGDVVREILDGFPVYAAARFKEAWSGPSIAAEVDRYVDRLIECLGVIADFNDKAYGVSLMDHFRLEEGYFHTARAGVEGAVNTLFRGTLLGMLVYFEYYLARVANPANVQRFGEIGREEIIRGLRQLRKIALADLGGPEPIAPPPIEQRTAPPGESLPTLLPIARNGLCPCGSGNLYKDCHETKR